VATPGWSVAPRRLGRGDELVISLERMRAIRRVDAEGATLVAEAGCTLTRVQEAAASAGLLFPLSLASAGTATIGGNIATNAGGHMTVRYGNTRRQVLGLEVVLADGRIYNGLTELRKDNSGYDLNQLFIGSEGTLGIVTAASLALAGAAPDADCTGRTGFGHSRAGPIAADAQPARRNPLGLRVDAASGNGLRARLSARCPRSTGPGSRLVRVRTGRQRGGRPLAARGLYRSP
jgi:FAD/FMN-containing dehydrogenase